MKEGNPAWIDFVFRLNLFMRYTLNEVNFAVRLRRNSEWECRPRLSGSAGSSAGARWSCVRGQGRGRGAKLMYLHPHPLSGPGLNRWFLFFLADLWQSHKRPLLWHGAKRLRPLLARAGEGGENRGELRRGRAECGGQPGERGRERAREANKEPAEDNNGQSTFSPATTLP